MVHGMGWGQQKLSFMTVAAVAAVAAVVVVVIVVVVVVVVVVIDWKRQDGPELDGPEPF